MLSMKHQQHTLKQTFKMRQISINLKQKQIKFNVTQFQAQGLSKDEIVQRVKVL